jgi:hypothetical protein
VPPDTSTLSPLRTAASRKHAAAVVMLPSPDEVVEVRRPDDEFSNVHRPKTAGNIRKDHVLPSGSIESANGALRSTR